MKNKLTLLIDGNWLLQSRFSVLSNGFLATNSNEVKKASQGELKDLMAKSISVILSRYPIIDNILLISDGGSWRKQLPVPRQLGDVTYKGNRSQESELDWGCIYGAFNEFIAHCKGIGITTTSHPNAEGDDWVWYWSRRLNSEGINCLIWSSDNDLKQLVQIDKNTNAFTAWYNDKNGLWLHDSIKPSPNIIDFFMQFEYFSPTLENLKARTTVNYINPDDIILSKIICGDSGDNIMPIIRYKKGNRKYRITEKDWDKLSGQLEIESIDSILGRSLEIASNILMDKKFYNLMNEGFIEQSKYDVADMIDYNIKLVWLHESTIPETLIMVMNQEEYKQYDISYIRNNYRVLLTEDNDIQSLFESI